MQLREQDFGNFQNPDQIKRDISDRNKFGRFYYRFPHGESSSDVYNRISIFEDHLIRDMRSGRFGNSTNLVLVTHGLTLRIFLMRWFGWTVESFLQVGVAIDMWSNVAICVDAVWHWCVVCQRLQLSCLRL